MSNTNDTPALARPQWSVLMAPGAEGEPPTDRPRSAFEERLRGWMDASERRFDAHMAANGDVLELTMLDIVGEDWWTGGGITSKAVQQKLAAYPKAKTIKVLLNSPGGDAFEGLAVQSILRRHGARIEVEVVGLAASAASIIAMAGDDIAMHEGSLMMVHQPWTFAVGDAAEMRTTADFLDKVNSSGLDVYTRRTGRQRKDVAALVEAETWMTAHEAVKEKFATSVVEGAAPGPVAKARAAAQIFMNAAGPRNARERRDAKSLSALLDGLNTNTPAPPAPVPSAKNPGTGEGNAKMKLSHAMAAVAAALGMSAEQIENAEDSDVLALSKNVRTKADTEPTPSVAVSGVQLVGVATEAEATAKIQDLQRGVMQVLGATGKATVAEAMPIVLAWKQGSEQAVEMTKKVAALTEEARVAKRDAAIVGSNIPPARHEWARTAFTTAEQVETFAAGLPAGFFSAVNEPKGDVDSMTLTPEEKKICATLGMAEERYLEEKKLLRKAG